MIQKDSFGIFVVIIDLLVIITILLFIYILDARQNEYIKVFKDKTIQMDDFAIRVKNLPKDSEYGDKEDILKAYLWSHFSDLLKNDEKLDGEFDDLNIDNTPVSCEIADITFGKQKIEHTSKLIRLNQLYRNYQMELNKRNNKNNERVRATIEAKQQSYLTLYEDEVKRYREELAASGNEEKLKDDQSVKYAYVTFRSMEGMQKILHLYNIGLSYRFFTNTFSCCCKKRY